MRIDLNVGAKGKAKGYESDFFPETVAEI